MSLSDKVINNIKSLYGDLGIQWLKNLPEFISHYENKWRFTAGDAFSEAQFNVVLNAIQDNGTSAVFKCCVPNKEFTTEVKSLEHYNGIGAVKLLKSDVENGAMLIEKITPGSILERVQSCEDATKYAVDVCKKLHRPIKNAASFPTLSDWFNGFERLYKKYDGKTGPFSKPLIEKAETVSQQLLSSQSPVVLLHGDLHYANLILNKDHYVAIDPKGVIGEAEFEIPLPRVTSLTKKEIYYRLDCFIEHSQFDQKRIYSWLFCKTVLAAWWTVEDSGAVSDFTHRFLFVAETMNAIM